MKKMKRILSLFLAIVTILGLLPTTAFARVDKTNLDEALDGVASKTFYILRSDEEVALRIYKKGGGLITGRTSTFGTQGTAAPGGTVSGITGVAYCVDHSKDYTYKMVNGKRVPYPYTVTIKTSDKNNVNCSWPAWLRGVIASGYPTKDLAWLKDIDYGYVTVTEGNCTGCKYTPITAAEWSNLQNCIANGSFTETAWEHATQLAIWHLTQGLELEGAVEPNGDRKRWANEQITYAAQDVAANTAPNLSKAILTAARFELAHAWYWQNTRLGFKVDGGAFFGQDAETGGSSILVPYLSQGYEAQGKEQNILDMGGLPDLGSRADSDESQLLVAKLQKEGFTATSGGNPNMLYDQLKSATNIAKHTINGKEYICIYFEMYSETQPTGDDKAVAKVSGLSEFNDAVAIAAAKHGITADRAFVQFIQDPYSAEALNPKATSIDETAAGKLEVNGTMRVVLRETVDKNAGYAMGIGSAAEPNAAKTAGNGSRSIGFGRLCIPTNIYKYSDYYTKATAENPIEIPGAESIKVDFSTETTSYDFYYGTSNGNAYQPVVLKDLNATVSGTVEFKWDGVKIEALKPGLNVKKYDGESGQPLGGAEFTLTCNNDTGCDPQQESYAGSTDGSGFVSFGEIRHKDGTVCAHTWTLIETKVPEPYQDNHISVTVNLGQTANTSNPIGIIPPDKEIVETIGALGNVLVTVPNIISPDDPGFIITKTDATTGAVLKGVKFTFTCEEVDPDQVRHDFSTRTVTTNENGMAIFKFPTCMEWVPNPTEDDPDAGDWEEVEGGCTHKWTYLEEKNPVVNGIKYQGGITGKFDKSTGSVNIRNIPGEQPTPVDPPSTVTGDPVTIIKQDADTGKILSGAWFALKNTYSGHEYRFEAPTGRLNLQYSNPNGANYIPMGSYAVTEVVAPEHYELSDEVYYVSIDNYGVHYTGSDPIVFRDNQKHVIEIEKRDANSKLPLSGATFDYWVDGKYQGQTEASNGNGKIVLDDLQTGNYRFKEATAPEGYIKSDKEYNIYVDCSDSNSTKTHSLVIENQKLKTLVITKEDATNGWKLAGAQFGIVGVGNGYRTTVETDASGVARVEGLGYGTYQVTELRAPQGYSISTDPVTVVIDEKLTDDVISVSAFQDLPLAGLMIRKIDATTKQAIPNVGFLVEALDDGARGETYYTDDNGIIVIEDAKPGWYRITETTTPAGYVANTEPQLVQLDADHKSQTVTFENNQKGLLNILKLDGQTGQPLAGATFEVRTAAGELVAEVTTLANGYATVGGLVPGSYVVRETIAPDHYVIDYTPQTFEVGENDSGKTYLLVFRNDGKTNLYIRKVDADTQQALAGAEFKVTTLDGKVIAGSLKTGEDGLALLPDVEPDTYVITEIGAPEGYLLDAPAQTIKVLTGQTVTVQFEDNKPGSIAIKKVDAATGEALEGAEFDLYDLRDNKLGSYTTDKDGLAHIPNVDPGWYHIVETKAPDGYQIIGDPAAFEVLPFKETEVVVTNTQKSSLTIEKRDKDTNVLLEGAHFKVTDFNGAVVAADIVTGKNGTVTINGLAEGNYYVTEIQAPAGYNLDSTPKLVTAKGDAAVIVSFYDVQMHGLVIRKVDAKMGTPLAGAVFDLYELNGNLVGTYTTDTSGSITTKPLAPGFYTLKEITAPAGYEIGWLPSATTGSATPGNTKVGQQTIQITEGTVVTVTIPNTALPVIEIQKADSVTGKPLAGAQFSVTDEHGNVVGTYTTGTTGNVFTEQLPSGWYRVTEIAAPQGYTKANSPLDVKLVAGTPTVARFTDEPLTSLLIIKHDSLTGEPLAGAQFEVRTLTGEVLGRYTTGENGTVSTEPLQGTVTIVEVIAPDGYALDSKEYTVAIRPGEANSISFGNDQLATLTVYKADTEGKPIAGARIKLETADGGFLAEGMTDSSGEVIFTGLKAGHVIVTEVAAATGYEMVSDPVTFRIRYNVKNRVELTNAQWGGLMIKLTDKHDGHALPNGTFTVTHCADNSIVYTGTTDTAGTILVGALIPGHKYIVTHTMAPDGYTIGDREKSEFIVAGENRVVLFEDVTVGIVIEKVDALTGKTLAGARFQLTRNSDNIVIGEYVTGTDGLALASGLIPGMYTVEEIEAPANYTIDEPSKLVHVKEGTTAHVTFKDTPYAGITIKAVDDATNSPLSGVTFEIWQQNGELVTSLTTDSTGVVQSGVLAPGYYVIKLVGGKSGYEVMQTEKTVQIKDGIPVTETFRLNPNGTVNVYAVDNNYKGLSGMLFSISKINGELIGSYRTGSSGMVTVTGLQPGWYVATETRSPDGFVIKTSTRNFLVRAGSPTNVYFTHDKTYGVQIHTTVEQTGQPLEGVQYRITKPNGEIIKTYTSNSAGLIYVPLDPGDYVITPVSLPQGYKMPEGQTVTVVKANQFTEVDFVATQLSSVRVHMIDGDSGKGVYGVRVLLKDALGKVVGELWSDNEGYVRIEQELVDGRYMLEQITVPSDYTVDSVPKSIELITGETTEVTWVMRKNVGQVQVELRSEDFNSIRGLDKNTLLAGGVFEIIDPVTYKVIDTMTTDAYGVAASKGIPLGRYIVRQKDAPAYYATSTQQPEVTLKIPNDVVRVPFYDPSLMLMVEIDHQSNKNVTAGQTMRVDVTKAGNYSNIGLTNGYLTIKVPTDSSRIGVLYTGTWNQAVWYTISYKTNMEDYKELMKDLNSTSNNQIDLSSTALGLRSGEYVTEVRYEFDVIPTNFLLTNNPAYILYILPGVYNDYKVITRMEFGGKYKDAWTSNTSLWTTNVVNYSNKSGAILPWGDGLFPKEKLPSSLPKTGY